VPAQQNFSGNFAAPHRIAGSVPLGAICASNANRRAADMQSVVLPLRWPWRVPPEPPAPDDFTGKLIILASEGRPIPQAAIKLAGRMAENAGAEVHVLSIARIWGTSLGLPNPGLLPNKRELKEQHDHVEAAVTWLKRRDIAASGQVTGTRNAAKLILAEARRRRADAIVMGADPPQSWFISGMIWSQEPYRVRRLAPVPVYLVVEGEQTGAR
jgi:nucleotide-binding universal stress UspA family protein